MKASDPRSRVLLEEPRKRAILSNHGGAFGMSNGADRKPHWAQVPDANRHPDYPMASPT